MRLRLRGSITPGRVLQHDARAKHQIHALEAREGHPNESSTVDCSGGTVSALVGGHAHSRWWHRQHRIWSEVLRGNLCRIQIALYHAQQCLQDQPVEEPKLKDAPAQLCFV